MKTKRVLKTYIPGDHQLANQRGSSGKQNGDEKKTRKIMSELGLKKVTGVSRVTIRKSKYILVITKPDVYKNPSSDTYIMFGEAKNVDLGQQDQMEATSKFKVAEVPQVPDAGVAAAQAAVAEDDDDEEVEAEGVEGKDIELVRSQATMTRHREETHLVLCEMRRKCTTLEQDIIFVCEDIKRKIEMSCNN